MRPDARTLLTAICNLVCLLACVTMLSVLAEDNDDDTTAGLFLGLRITGEPSLRSDCKGDYQALRFVEYDSGGAKGLIRVVHADGEIKYTHRAFIEHARPATSTRLIDVNDWQVLIEEFESGGFWSSNTQTEPWVTDATIWLFESCINGRYHSMQAYPERDLRMNDAVGALVSLKL